jgi:hypothetical protein
MQKMNQPSRENRFPIITYCYNKKNNFLRISLKKLQGYDQIAGGDFTIFLSSNPWQKTIIMGGNSALVTFGPK